MSLQQTIHTLFESQVERMPDNTAVVYAGKSLAYGKLNEKANQLAHHLRENGVKPGAHVALCMDRSIDCLITILAILKAGGAYIPLDPSQPEERLLFILNDNGTPVLIVKSKPQEQFIHYQGKIIIIDNDAKKISKQANHNLSSLVTPQDLAYVIYTSGSTGIPKGVLIEHRSVVNYCSWFADYCHCEPQERIDFSSNYIFDMAVTTSIVPLTLGLTVVICNDELKHIIRPYLQHLEKNKVNIVKITPSYFKVLLHEVKNNFIALPHLKTIVLGGENLSSADCASWLALYPEQILFNEYGPTEATVAVSQYRVCKANLSASEVNIPIGTPGQNMKCYILGADNALVLEGEIGELYIGGVSLARGYLNQPELTESLFITDPFSNKDNARLYKSGDLCRQGPNGVIEYLGRIDAQVKIRGFRVEPGEIEKYLVEHPAIDAAIVLAREEHLNEKRLIAYYILKEASKAPSASQLRQYLQKRLPDYMIPTVLVRVDAFPLTANGKLDFKALPVPQFITSQHYLAPSSALEKTIADIWSEELGVKPIGLEDDFFELGGHSLSAARIISKINNTLEKSITLYEFYSSPTIAKLVTIVRRVKNTGEKDSVMTESPFADSALLPLSDFQFMLWLSNTFEPKATKLNIIARKRMQGRLNIAALAMAFEAILVKHEILSYRVLKFRPMQFFRVNRPFKIIENNLEILSERACELALVDSVKELISHYPWHKDAPMIIARLFYLKDEVTELQICMPHMVSDDVSPDILFYDLSKYYLLYNDQSIPTTLNIDKQYRHYIHNEQHYIKAHLDRDLIFWDEYLQDIGVFEFPPESIVKDMKSQSFSYSTYLEIPEQGLNNLQRFCAKNHVSINDGLCAVLTLALSNCCDDYNKNAQSFVINIVKSTRDNQCYDDAIGCFLRIEPIKVFLNKKATLASVAKQVHQSVIDTNLYQQCSGLLKLACLGTYRRKRKPIENYLMMVFTYIYTTIFPTPRLNRKILNLCRQLSSFKRNNNFIININVQNDFIADGKAEKESSLFGLKPENIEIYQYDLLTINYFFDVCFLREGSHNIPYVVISANLKPDFRELIAKEMVRIIGSDALIQLPHHKIPELV